MPSHQFAAPYLAQMDAGVRATSEAAITLGGASQPLTFEVSLSFELPRKA